MTRTHTIRWFFIFLAPVILISGLTCAEGKKGRFGIGGFGAAAVPLGQEAIRDQGDEGTDAGGTLRYGLSEKWMIAASYDNIDLTHGIRREPLTLSMLHFCSPDQRVSPVFELGMGGASNQSGGPFNNLSAKAGLGLEFALSKMFSIGPQLNFHYISENGDAVNHAWVMSPGVIAMLYFGGNKAEPVAQVTQAPPPAAPPIAEPVAVSPPVAVAAVPALPDKEVSIRMDIQFDSGKDVVKPQYDAELKKVANFLTSYPGTSAQVEGHSDSTGAADFNKTLSQRRADSVKNALVSRMGVDASRLTAVGFGQEKPVADNGTAEGRAQNRRVVAVVTATVPQ